MAASPPSGASASRTPNTESSIGRAHSCASTRTSPPPRRARGSPPRNQRRLFHPVPPRRRVPSGCSMTNRGPTVVVAGLRDRGGRRSNPPTGRPKRSSRSPTVLRRRTVSRPGTLRLSHREQSTCACGIPQRVPEGTAVCACGSASRKMLSEIGICGWRGRCTTSLGPPFGRSDP